MNESILTMFFPLPCQVPQEAETTSLLSHSRRETNNKTLKSTLFQTTASQSKKEDKIGTPEKVQDITGRTCSSAKKPRKTKEGGINDSYKFTASEYETLLSSVGNKFITLKQLKLDNIPEECVLKSYNVYGVVESIKHENELTRKVIIKDPTCFGFSVKLENIDITIGLKDILILENIRIISTPIEKQHCLSNQNDCARFVLFDFDYENNSEEDFKLFFRRNLDKKGEMPIVKYLEEWVSHTILTSFTLNQIRYPTKTKTFVDIACLVIGIKRMLKSVVLTVLDGHNPNYKVTDPFLVQYSSEHNANSFYRLNEEACFLVNSDQSNLAFINIWNADRANGQNYATAMSLSLSDGDDLIVLLNVELDADLKCSERSVKLVLRSDPFRSNSTAIKKVSRKSILGRKLLATIFNSDN